MVQRCKSAFNTQSTWMSSLKILYTPKLILIVTKILKNSKPSNIIHYLFFDDDSLRKVHLFIQSIMLRSITGILFKIHFLTSFPTYFEICSKNRFLSSKPSYTYIIQQCYKYSCAICVCMHEHDVKYSPWVLKNVAHHRLMSAWNKKWHKTKNCMYEMLQCALNGLNRIIMRWQASYPYELVRIIVGTLYPI